MIINQSKRNYYYRRPMYFWIAREQFHWQRTRSRLSAKKQTELKYHHIKNLFSLIIINFKHVWTFDQPTDVLTKPVSLPALSRLICMNNMWIRFSWYCQIVSMFLFCLLYRCPIVCRISYYIGRLHNSYQVNISFLCLLMQWQSFSNLLSHAFFLPALFRKSTGFISDQKLYACLENITYIHNLF